jgi:hypothetical protein
MEFNVTNAALVTPGTQEAPVLAVEARLTERRPDGSVVGSYTADVMDGLLHHHTTPDLAQASGAMVLAGEVIKL